MKKMLISAVAVMMATGCVSIPDRAIRTSYATYNQTIAFNQSQQMLLNLVRLRYRELPMFLKVGALSSSFNFEVHGGGSIGHSFGEPNWGVNLGSSLSSRPTITYTPIEGNTFVKQLLGEIDPSTFVLLFRSGWPIETLCHVMVERIQENYNSAGQPTYAKFLEIIESLKNAHAQNRLNFVTSEGSIYLQITETDASIEGVGPDSPDLEEMVPFDTFQLRSLMDVMFFLAKNTEVPENQTSYVRKADPNGWLNIRVSSGNPGDALVWVEHNGHFFSIANSDIQSKDTFALVKMLFEIQAGDIKSVTPILTLPVAQP
jgi:hypothetical protein